MAEETTTTETTTTEQTTEWKPPASQADLDRIISDRLTRERARFSDYDDLKSKAGQYDALAAASKTEQEKAVDAAREEATTTEREKSNARIIAAEARALAATAKFHNPALAVKAIDLSGVAINADGEVDADAVKAKLKTLADAEPYLVDDGKGRVKPDRSQGGGQGSASSSVASGRDMYEAQKRPTANAQPAR